MHRRTLRLEQLERRCLLAGDVSAVLKGGDLIITGDQDPNDPHEAIKIECVAHDWYHPLNTYRVSGIGGTRVNGSLDPLAIPNVTRHVSVDLKTGKGEVATDLDEHGTYFWVAGDLTVKNTATVSIRYAQISGKVTVDGGSVVTLHGIMGAPNKETRVRAGTENDKINVDAVIHGKLTVDTGAGDDEVVLDHSTVYYDATLKTAAGKDSVTVQNYSWLHGRLNVDTAAGNDSVAVVSSALDRDVSVNTGDGDDLVRIDDSTLSGKLTVETGKGDDTVGMDPSTISRDANVKTGDGDDEVVLEQVALLAKLSVDTGNGADEVGMFESTAQQTLDIKTGNGEDSVGLAHVAVGANANIQTGNNDDRIGVVAGAVTGNLSIDSGNAGVPGLIGQDQVGVSGTAVVGKLTIKTGTGEDSVGIGDDSIVVDFLVDGFSDVFHRDVAGATGPVLVGSAASVTTGRGDDAVRIAHATAAVFSLDTGDGVDSGLIQASEADRIKVKMGSGDDLLTLDTSGGLPDTGELDGGAGQDHIYATPITHNGDYGGVTVRNWETFN
jgi:hypothetical protein